MSYIVYVWCISSSFQSIDFLYFAMLEWNCCWFFRQVTDYLFFHFLSFLSSSWVSIRHVCTLFSVEAFVSDILELYCSLCWTGIFILFFFGNFLITFEHILNSSCQLVYENIFHIFLFSLKIFKIPIISSSKIQYLLHKKTLKSWT